MVDFHTHIMPNVDDGSKSIEETFNLCAEAATAGFSKIILTPHYMEKYYETNNKEKTTWVEALNMGLMQKGTQTEAYLGNEIYISENIVQLLQEGEASTINNSKYVLMELPLDVKPIYLYDVIYSLMENDYIPILAHPERYQFVQKKPNIIYELIQSGVLIQSNFGSIIGQYGKKAQKIIIKLLENNMVHFLGSDAHRENTIYKVMPRVLKKLTKTIGTEKLREITTTNPEAILKNRRIKVTEPKRIKKTWVDKFLR